MILVVVAATEAVAGTEETEAVQVAETEIETAVVVDIEVTEALRTDIETKILL